MCKYKTKLCRRLFVATLFIIVRNWKQPNSQKENPPLNKLQYIGLPSWHNSKESACNAGDIGLIPGSGRSPGEGNGNLLQYSCLGNPMDRGV